MVLNLYSDCIALCIIKINNQSLRYLFVKKCESIFSSLLSSIVLKVPGHYFILIKGRKILAKSSETIQKIQCTDKIGGTYSVAKNVIATNNFVV